MHRISLIAASLLLSTQTAFAQVDPLLFQPPALYEGSDYNSVSTGDFNNDGFADLVGTKTSDSSFGTNVTLILNDGISRPGRFGPNIRVETDGDIPRSCACADLDNDGNDDIALAVSNSSTTRVPQVEIVWGDGNANFSSPTVLHGFDYFDYSIWGDIVVAHFNDDTYLDIAVVFGGRSELIVFINDGGRSFRPQVQYGLPGSPHSLVAADFRNTNRSDLAVTVPQEDKVVIFDNNGAGSFSLNDSRVVGASPYGLSAGDVCGNGRSDLAVACSDSDEIAVVENLGAGQWGSVTTWLVGTWPTSVAIEDLNRDGSSEVIVGHERLEQLTILERDHDCGLTESYLLSNPNHSDSVNATDLDRDGDPDIAIGCAQIAVHINIHPRQRTGPVTIRR